MHSKIVHNSKRLAQAKDSREWMHSSWCCDFVYCSAIFCFRQASAENNTWAHRNWTTATFSVFMIACRLLNIFGHQRFIVSNEQHEQRDDGATMMRLRTSRKCFQKKLTAPNDWYLISGCDFEATFLKFCEIQRSICIYLASSFLSLTGRGMVNMSTQISGIIMMKIWSTHFVCGLFRFGRNSVNNWLFSLLSFDGWSKNRVLCIDVLMLHEMQRGCRCTMNSVRTKSVYITFSDVASFVVSVSFLNVMWLRGSRIPDRILLIATYCSCCEQCN